MTRRKAQGYKLYRDDGASGLTKQIIQLIDIDPEGASATQINATDHDSVGQSFVAGPTDPGEFTFDINWDPVHASHVELLTDLEAGTTQTYQLHFPAGYSMTTCWEFDASVVGFSPQMPAEGVNAATVTFRTTGSVDYNATPWT